MEITRQSAPSDKLALFRSYFHGRQDLYPRRFVSKKTGKSGYSPVCANEWVEGICQKPKIKCSDCQHRRLLPVSNEVIWQHLSGWDDLGKDCVLGVYPIALDETCQFLAADFDKASWEKDVLAYRKTCQMIGAPAAIERSRSGQGAHVWIFFSEPVPAVMARKLGAHILTETMERYPEIGFDSYDRFFPNQDTLPQGGFGNLIALPLQKKPRDLGNTVFVDEALAPFEDQWAFLSCLKKMSRDEVESIVFKAEARGRIVGAHFRTTEEDDCVPWNRQGVAKAILKSDVPKTLELVIANEIFIEKERLSPSLKNRLLRLAAFPNPEFYKAQAMRLSTHDKPRMISCSSDYPNYIGLPRGCLETLMALLDELEIEVTIRDERNGGRPLNVSFLGELREKQRLAGEALLKADCGVLAATTAFGKTVLSAWLIAERKVNTLILVHRKQLQAQWVERLSTFLQIEKGSIGLIGGGKRTPTGQIDVAVIQSLVRKGVVDPIVSEYGHVIVDECHHLPAFSFEQVARHAKAKYILGLSATVARKDGHHPIIFMQCGPVRYRVDPKTAAAERPFAHTVFVRPTSFSPKKSPHADLRIQFHELNEELMRDDVRNELICADILAAVQKGRSPLVLTERTEHLETLFTRLKPKICHLVVLRGGMSSKAIAMATKQIAEIAPSEPRVLLATGKFAGEGFDDARLDTLFLTMPISWKGTVAQYAGRLHRLYAEKKEVQIVDYADFNVAMLEKMFNRRCQGYEAVGYKIILPASATAGWPSEIALPADLSWRSAHAKSIKRLIVDGIEPSLAKLFSESATSIPLELQGEERARSATERFLFQRIETIPTTRGLFELNAQLEIAFDGWGQMEVDFLHRAKKLVIEIDGDQHLGCKESYRRDRRKDALLQQNGYTVLRFLSEDVSKQLDLILDAILRHLSS